MLFVSGTSGREDSESSNPVSSSQFRSWLSGSRSRSSKISETRWVTPAIVLTLEARSTSLENFCWKEKKDIILISLFKNIIFKLQNHFLRKNKQIFFSPIKTCFLFIIFKIILFIKIFSACLNIYLKSKYGLNQLILQPGAMNLGIGCITVSAEFWSKIISVDCDQCDWVCISY